MLDESLLRQVMASVLGVDPALIDSEASMDTIPAWDSLRHMNMVLALEEEFGITIPDEDAGSITSYPLVRVVLEHQLRTKG